MYYYNNVRGSYNVAALVSSSKFPDSPDDMYGVDGYSQLTQVRSAANYFGVMVEGFVQAPATGKYKFFTYSDDSSEVWVSEQAGRTDNLTKVVELTGCCREIAGNVEVDWVQGQLYYIRGLLYERWGNEYLQIGMQIQGGQKFMPIPVDMFVKPSNPHPCAT